jgi:hypothetical protein
MVNKKQAKVIDIKRNVRPPAAVAVARPAHVFRNDAVDIPPWVEQVQMPFEAHVAVDIPVATVEQADNPKLLEFDCTEAEYTAAYAYAKMRETTAAAGYLGSDGMFYTSEPAGNSVPMSGDQWKEMACAIVDGKNVVELHQAMMSTMTH